MTRLDDIKQALSRLPVMPTNRILGDLTWAVGEIERLQVDAARYRWLARKHAFGVSAIAWAHSQKAMAYSENEVDKAVDAAIADEAVEASA